MQVEESRDPLGGWGCHTRGSANAAALLQHPEGFRITSLAPESPQAGVSATGWPTWLGWVASMEKWHEDWWNVHTHWTGGDLTLRTEAKREGRPLEQVIPGHLFLCCCRAQKLEQPSPAPSASGLAGIPWCTMSNRALPYLPCSHWLSLFPSNLTDHSLNVIFCSWTINIVDRCRKHRGAAQIMFFNSVRERDLAGDYMGQNHACFF